MELLCVIAGWLIGICVFLGYRKGLKDGGWIKGDKPIAEPSGWIMRKKKTQKAEFDPKTEAILKNIDSYDGTAAGQKKID